MRDEAIAIRINETIGARVVLSYEQHIGIPTTCFAEAQYFATTVKVVQEPGFLPGGAPAPPAEAPGP